MKRASFVIGLLVLVLMMATAVQAEQNPALTSQDVKSQKLNEHSGNMFVQNIIPNRAAFDELDEIVGDTVIVGTTFRDMQHNSTLGRMIAVDEWADGSTTLHFTWCYRESEPGTSNAWHLTATLTDLGDVTILGEPTQANVGNNFGAYQIMLLEDQNDIPIITYHGGPSVGDDYNAINAQPNPWIPGLWNNYTMPELAVVTMWPHSVGSWYNGNYYVHSLLNEYDPDNLLEDGLYYNRSQLNLLGSSFTNATPGGENQVEVTDVAMNLANALAISADGSHVAVANTVGRFNLYDEGDESTQYNNEILYWESIDGGDSWNFGTENATIITNFVAPNPEALPDTTVANGDTMRAYTEIDMIYDENYVLHVTFNTPMYYFYEGTISVLGARQWYWNSQDQEFIQIQDANYFNSSNPMDVAVWERQVGNANLYLDPETDILWCSFVQYGEEDLYTIVGEEAYPLDSSDEAVQATDVWVTASPDMGKHWARPVNITKTRNLDYNLQAGETESEREMTMAMNSDGDWLHLLYTVDYDPGIASPGGDDSLGDPTLNNVVYHRVAKQALIDSFEVNAEWVRNYPLHIDSTGFYEDPNDWEYTDFFLSVSESDNELNPNQFELKQNYPNPFNPSTQIDFNLAAPGKVKLAVYDILGREVAVLTNRNMTAGSHSINFYAGDLASGVYFYTLSSGTVSKTQKMVLMK